jgi:hypothetical protein
VRDSVEGKWIVNFSTSLRAWLRASWIDRRTSSFFLYTFYIYSKDIMGPYFGWAPGCHTSCPGPKPALAASRMERPDGAASPAVPDALDSASVAQAFIWIQLNCCMPTGQNGQLGSNGSRLYRYGSGRPDRNPNFVCVESQTDQNERCFVPHRWRYHHTYVDGHLVYPDSWGSSYRRYLKEAVHFSTEVKPIWCSLYLN